MKDDPESEQWSVRGHSDMQKRLEYAMAIVRFVNLIVEPSQNKAYAESIKMLASKIGLPPHFIDVRYIDFI
jgi:hypothetical protein